MKYLTRAILAVFVLAVIYSCGNEGGTSPINKRDTYSFLDYNVYYGSPNGAVKKVIDTIKVVEKTKVVNKQTIKYKDTTYLNVDSLHKAISRDLHFTGEYATVRDANKVTFEFLNDQDNILSYTDGSSKIIAHYIYKTDSLCVLKNGDDPVYVVRKNGNEFFRRKLIYRSMITSGTKPKDETAMIDEVQYTLEQALKKAGFENKESFTNPGDTIVWCNVKYTYK